RLLLGRHRRCWRGIAILGIDQGADFSHALASLPLSCHYLSNVNTGDAVGAVIVKLSNTSVSLELSHITVKVVPVA
ncbi:MAG TPA: hypothetical protein PKE45_01315, partial [Caldilineaceae bacterium]|nr:hypothetical protein [Caldilineaceae bacterium]